MKIGTAATQSGVPSKMIRYYERIGLIPPVERRPSGYRAYDEADVHTLCFIKRARHLGFSVEEVRDLLELWGDRTRSSADVRERVKVYLDVLNRKRRELESIRRALANLTAGSRYDPPGSPILEDVDDVVAGQPR